MGEAALPVVRLSPPLMAELRAKEGDPVYITDTRWWLGGLHSVHAIVGGILESDDAVVEIGPGTHDLVVTRHREETPVKVERLY